MEGWIGQYRITRTIGEGGMGIVYAADHALLGRQAAIKVLLPEMSRKQDIVSRFFNEAKAATSIRHPGIIEIYDFGWHTDGSAYIVMEYLDGETLGARAARSRLAPAAALAIVRQLAGALGAAHGKGIVHRDLKPDNVFLVHDPEVHGGERIKLLDFGIAKLAGDATMPSRTRTGAVMGTPTYMAPEQCRGVAVDHRADLYALGCILFELCVGRPPFVGEGSGDVLAAHIHVPPPRMSAIAPGVSPKLEAFVQRLLAKSPAERFQSCDEVVRAIDALNSTLGTSSHVAVPRAAPTPGTALTTITTLSVATEQRHASPATSRSRRIVIALGVAALASIAVVLTLVRVRGETGPVPDRAPEIERAPSREQPDASRPVLDPMPPPAPPADAGVFDAGVEQGAIEISSSPAGADVLIDGKRVGRTPYRAQRAMSAGEITLVIDLAGYQKRTVTVDGSVPIRQAFKLEPKRQPRGSRPSRDDSVNPFSN